jgi:hypothetical protein
MSRMVAVAVTGILCVELSVAARGYAEKGSATTQSSQIAPATGTGGSDHASRTKLTGPSKEPEFAGPEAGFTDNKRPVPHITIEDIPPNLPVSWLFNQRIELIINLALLVLVYIGLMIAVRTIAKARRRLQGTEAIVQSLTESASSVLARVEAMMAQERSWLTTKVESSLRSGNGFSIIAQNCGRCPAEIVTLADRIGILANESCLPEIPEYTQHGIREFSAPLTLVPGESKVLQTFSGTDLDWICGSAESRRRIESEQDHLFVYGRVRYRDVIAVGDSRDHETNWCHEYTYDGSRWGLIAAGSAEYNKRT